jgi:RNA polymerase sigma factor (sigma-70 family)
MDAICGNYWKPFLRLQCFKADLRIYNRLYGEMFKNLRFTKMIFLRDTKQALRNNLSFSAVYESHCKMVYNLALQYVQNVQDAEDITQEVFVKLHQNLHLFDAETATLKTWIYRITINQSLDFIKSKKAKKRFGFITALFSGDNNEPLAGITNFNHPGVAAEDKEALQHIFRLINSLPDNQRTAFILARLEDKSQKEIAEIMNLTTKAVESLLQRAKQSLQKKLNNSEG